jgi:hypothetical protein
MNPPKLAQRDTIRLFSIHDQNVAVVTGKKPRNHEMPHLVKQGERRLVLEFAASEGFSPQAGGSDSYIIVQPVSVTAKLGAVEVWHAEGCDRVEVEPLKAEDRATDPEMFGISQDFSLETAIKDALSRLSPEAQQREPQLFDVVSMGVLYGGFSGFSRLFVRMLPSDLEATADLPAGRKNVRKGTAHRARCQTAKP